MTSLKAKKKLALFYHISINVVGFILLVFYASLIKWSVPFVILGWLIAGIGIWLLPKLILNKMFVCSRCGCPVVKYSNSIEFIMLKGFYVWSIKELCPTCGNKINTKT